MLFFVKTMDFVHEEDGRKMAKSIFVFCLIGDRSDVLNARSAAREGTERAASVMGNDLGDAGLSATRRSK